jgi:hypothetical protein
MTSDQLTGELMDVIVGGCLLGASLLGASLLGVHDQEDRLISHTEAAGGQP